MEYQKVKAVQDDSCHWYIIPAELEEDFNKDLDENDEDLAFDEKYGEYRTGGDLNLVQLYIKITRK